VSYVDYLWENFDKIWAADGYCMTLEEYLAGLPSDEARQQALKEYEDAFKPKGSFQDFMAEIDRIPQEAIDEYRRAWGLIPKLDSASGQKLASSKGWSV
jgi:uncharacterized membrane protein